VGQYVDTDVGCRVGSVWWGRLLLPIV
jgi:hypothetical protein